MRFKIHSLLFLLFALPNTAKAVEHQEVKLQKKAFPSIGKLEGLSNIFFRPLDDSTFQYPGEWEDIEIASIVDNRALLPIYAVRYKDLSVQIKYVVDTDGDRDFRNETVLLFRQNETLQIADTVLTIRRAGKKDEAQKVGYQLMISGDGYTYSRLSEYRQGEIRFGSNSYSLVLKPRSRNTPLYDMPEIVCLIDIDRDGNFSNTWRLSDSGKISQTEEVAVASPFVLDGKKIRIVQLDAGGTQLTIESTKEEVSISTGFKAPDFSLADTNNNVFALTQLRGKVVFLEFWSVSCPVCKRILPQINSLIKSKAGKDFVALAIAKEDNRAEIEAYLKEQPINANVVPKQKSTWQTYDNPGITPAFYLIDREGVIRFSGYGGYPEQIRILERMIEELRGK